MTPNEVMYEPAIQLVPGMLSARDSKRPADIGVLLTAYHQEAVSKGLTESQSWSVLLGATMQWLDLMVDNYAEKIESTSAEVINTMAIKAALWKPSDDKA